MAAPRAWFFTTATRTAIMAGTIKSGDTYNVALFNSSWVTTTTTYSTTNELATQYGYTQGGVSIGTVAIAGTTSVTFKFPASIVSTWNVSGGTVTFRAYVLYSVTDAAKTILAWGYPDSTPADVSVTTGNSLTCGTTSATIYTLA